MLTTVPFTSLTVADSCALAPTAIVVLEGSTVTLLTAKFETVTVAVPLLPSLVAVMVAVPALTALTKPSVEIDATVLSEVAHVIARPVTNVPFASFVVAVSCVFWPTEIDNGFGVTTTVATGACVTVIVAASLFPSAVPVSVAVPAPRAVTMPFASIVATAVLLLDQMIARSLRMFWPASYATPVSWVLSPGAASM